MSERIDRRASRFPLWLRRGPSEAVAMTLIGLGVVMLMQPFSLDLFSYSFVTILAGTLGFVIVSHFPD
ncbi:MAG TPA: hypothetical protein VNZ53_16870 [Steroidobacteraceae bacterium]|jgi:hypothetical protein|nr:hypothetical protein [Steroidobacteraceae bacterium]